MIGRAEPTFSNGTEAEAGLLQKEHGVEASARECGWRGSRVVGAKGREGDDRERERLGPGALACTDAQLGTRRKRARLGRGWAERERWGQVACLLVFKLS